MTVKQEAFYERHAAKTTRHRLSSSGHKLRILLTDIADLGLTVWTSEPQLATGNSDLDPDLAAVISDSDLDWLTPDLTSLLSGSSELLFALSLPSAIFTHDATTNC